MAGRPALSPSGGRSSTPRAVRLPPELAAEVAEYLNTHEIGFSELVRSALEAYLEQESSDSER